MLVIWCVAWCVLRKISHCLWFSIPYGTKLETVLQRFLMQIAGQYGIVLETSRADFMFEDLTRALVALHEGKQVVILIDEYDKPILDNIDNITEAQHIRDVLKGFYTIIKSMDEYVRFVFLTGVSKFSKVGVFSGLNNLRDLTLDNRYAAMLGITQEELETYLADHLEAFGGQAGLSKKALLTQIKFWYNGFCFSSRCEPVYNPFSLLQLLDAQQFRYYWFESGTPTFLLQLLKKGNYDVPLLEELAVDEIDFSTYDVERLQIVPLLFQSGYLTITGYEQKTLTYYLSYPNYGVRRSFLAYLLDAFSEIDLALNRKTGGVVAWEDETVT